MWDIDMGYGIWYIDMVIHHVSMVTLDIDMEYGLMIWEMTVSIWSSWISIWDILSLCMQHPTQCVALLSCSYSNSGLLGVTLSQDNALRCEESISVSDNFAFVQA